jgi:hypothetical protein
MWSESDCFRQTRGMIASEGPGSKAVLVAAPEKAGFAAYGAGVEPGTRRFRLGLVVDEQLLTRGARLAEAQRASKEACIVHSMR